MNKRGGKYTIIVNLILGLIALTIILYFIFQEYFSEDLTSREACRQSIYLRANSPEINKLGIGWFSFKDKFPLKCKTEVIEVTKEDIEKDRVGKIIGDALVSCWALFGNGDLEIFPASGVKTTDTYCVPCARIHLSPEAKKTKRGKNLSVDIEKEIKSRGVKGVSYYNLLHGIGKSFSAFSIGNVPFKFEGWSFEVKPSKGKEVKNRETGEKETIDVAEVFLPKYINLSRDDMVIVFEQARWADKEKIGNQMSSLFYYPSNQDIFSELNQEYVDFIWVPFVTAPYFCEHWDGIPA